MPPEPNSRSLPTDYMRITVINGTEKYGVTYRLIRSFADITEALYLQQAQFDTFSIVP